MDHDHATSEHDPALERAWRRHAELDLAAEERSRRFYRLRTWIAWLGILTVLLAILVREVFPLPLDTAQPPFRSYAVIGLGVKVLFILTPILASALAALAMRLYSNGSFLVYRAGAEEVKKEIFLYRTVLPKDGNASRRDYLERRLDEIRAGVERNLGGKSKAATYRGPLPLGAYNKRSKQIRHGADPGFHDLSGDDYVTYRLKDQLDWHRNKIGQRRRERLVMTVAVLAAGGLGALLAAFGGFLAIWVALTASVTLALLGWQELKKTDEVIKNYSRVVLELGFLYNHWQSLEKEERTPQEVEKMALGCENVLWTQNGEYVRAMQSALSQADLEKDAALINQILRESKETARRAREKVVGNIKEAGRDVLEDTKARMIETSKGVLETLWHR